MTRRYLPSTLPRLAAEWDGPGPATGGAVVAADDGEETEYAALMTAPVGSGPGPSHSAARRGSVLGT